MGLTTSAHAAGPVDVVVMTASGTDTAGAALLPAMPSTSHRPFTTCQATRSAMLRFMLPTAMWGAGRVR